MRTARKNRIPFRIPQNSRPVTTTYVYDGDKLVGIRGLAFLGNVIPYESDANGNLTDYGNYELTWTQGNKLETVTNSNGTYRYFYDENGLRYKKERIENGVVTSTTRYYYDGASIIAEDRDGELIQYYYDSTGVIGMSYNGEEYLYYKDIFGNITHIVDCNLNIVAQYKYDAWGNYGIETNINGIATANPFRYRGYYMDVESDYYYLQTRYYSPVLRRFLSHDRYDLLSTCAEDGHLNLYAYCNNNPVMYTDPTGEFPFFLLTALIAVGITALVDYIPDKELNLHWGWYAGATLVGATIGMGISHYATGNVFSSVGNVFSGIFGKTTYYRTMSADDYATLKYTGKLPAGTETFISPSSTYVSGYNGVTVKFTVRNKTVNWLTKVGVRDSSALVSSMYPSMPIVSKGWMATNAFFKAEQSIINIGLGYGRALDIFNKGILIFGLL